MLLDEPDLEGLPDFFIASAARGAADRGHPGKYAITLSRSSVEPFLQFSGRRDLRETVFRAWTARGENGGASDNRAIAAELVRLRAERARLLGYKTYAHYRLADTMAKTPEAALGLLESVWTPGVASARKEEEALQAIAASEGGNFKLAPWDWRYLAEKRRKAEFDLDESELKPYLQLDRIIEAAFYAASRLFGLEFHRAPRSQALSPRRSRMGGDGPRWRAESFVPGRLFCEAVKAQRGVDERLPRPAEA